MMTNRAVLFDMDDTLLLTREIKWAHHRQVAKDNWGIELDDETLRRHWGEPFDVMIGHYYRDAAPLEEMRAANKASGDRFLKQPVPGAAAIVGVLADAGVVVGVVTSTNTDMATADLARCGFPMERIAFVHGADVCRFHKPDPRVFDAALEVLALRGVDDVTYVGDALMDAEAAEDAGLGFVGITTGLFDADDFGPDRRVVDDLAELPGVLGLFG